jgi:hypothetical protein
MLDYIKVAFFRPIPSKIRSIRSSPLSAEHPVSADPDDCRQAAPASRVTNPPGTSPMKSVVTFLLPGLGQLFSGDAKKGGIMFLSAVIAGSLTAGLGYFVCGAWSVFDLKSRAAGSSSASAIATLLTTTEAPAPAAKAGSFQALMPWLFKFSVLGLCAFLVLNSVRGGGALQSLELFGVRLHFASLASEAGAASERPPGERSGSGQAAFDAVANALVSDETNAAPAGSRGATESGSPGAYNPEPAAEPIQYEVPSAPVSSFAGQWGSDLGATYQIRESNRAVEITETSKILFVPFISMTCRGQTTGAYVRAECTTYDRQTGELVLAVDPTGGLGGVFTAHANGMQIPLNLHR